MPSFGSLNIAYTGLNAHQRRVGVIGENIANVDTPGYHRQKVELGSIHNMSSGFIVGDLQRGGGVEVVDIARIRSETLSAHAREQGGRAAAAGTAADTVNQLEGIIGGLEPGGLHDQMVDLFNAFDDLAGSPDDPAMRRVVLQRADILAQGFTRTAGAIDDLRERTIAETSETVRAINTLADKIAAVDVEVLSSVSIDADPNTLLDRRDAMVSELAELADVNVVRNDNGQVTIALDGQLLVTNGRSQHLSVASIPDASLTPLGYARVAVVNDTGRELTVSGGKLSAQLSGLNTTIPDVRTEMDAVGVDLATQVNAVHEVGVGLDGSTGLDLFTIGPGTGEITLSVGVADQPDKVAAGLPGNGALDNTNARDLAQLADAPDGPLAGFVSTVGALASRVATANGAAEAAGVAKEQADNLALAAGGVSLDEELTDLISAQRAYEASARMINAIDDMLQTLMTTGLVGR